MTEGQLVGVVREGVLVALKIAAPILTVSIVIGLVIAIFQAATQIHEQTLTFVPKVIVIAMMLLAMGSWMYSLMESYIHQLFSLMATLSYSFLGFNV